VPPTPYNQGIFRAGPPATTTDPLVPEPLALDIIQKLPEECATLKLAKHVQMSTSTLRQPVLDVLPTAYFVNQTVPDMGLKRTTNQAWANVNLIVEEIAVIVPVPDSYLADAAFPIWDQIRPRLVEAIGKTIDQACLFGVGSPATWSPGIVPAAIAAGNTVTSGTGADIAVDLAVLGERVTKEGITNVTGWATRPGFKWKLMQTRSSQGVPIYEPDLQNGTGGSLFGYPAQEVKNGAWDPTLADLVMGDWTMALLGMRQDISFKMFDQGVINDASGVVIWNAMQNDGQAMRVTMRLAWATANPVTALRPNAATRFPFGVLRAPAGQQS